MAAMIPMQYRTFGSDEKRSLEEPRTVVIVAVLFLTRCLLTGSSVGSGRKLCFDSIDHRVYAEVFHMAISW